MKVQVLDQVVPGIFIHLIEYLILVPDQSWDGAEVQIVIISVVTDLISKGSRIAIQLRFPDFPGKEVGHHVPDKKIGVKTLSKRDGVCFHGCTFPAI